ncbi:hypothetical protein V2G26_021452 [Clonostachys chloroleuca]
MGNAFTRETPRPQPQQQTQPRPKPLPRQLPPRPNQLLGAREELHTTPTPFRLHNWDPNFLFDNERQVLHAPQTPGTLRQLSRKPCRFFAKGHCKKGGSCTFLHENTKGREEATASRDDEIIDDSTREFGGAWAEFGNGATTDRVSLPSDFSAIRIGNLPSDSSAISVLHLLSDVDLIISPNDVRLTKHTDSTKCTAVVKVKDPLFSKEACRKLGTCITLRDLELIVDRCNHIASRLQQKLRTGKVKVNKAKVMAYPPTPQKNQESETSWMVKLTGLPETIKEEDIIQAIPKLDRPRRVEIGEMNYVADMEIDSTLIQSMLYEFGPLEKWEVSDTTKGMRVKAHATFLEESQAHHAASTLDGKRLPFCDSSKLFVEAVTSVRFKVSTRVYDVIQQRINSNKSSWDRQYIYFFAFPSRGFYRVLKLEGRDRESVAKAKQDLDVILAGEVMRLDGKAILYPGSKISRESYKRLKMVEEELGVVIIRDMQTSQFRVFGAEAPQALATKALDRLIKETISAQHFISLSQEPDFRWAVDGGFRALESQLGSDKASFDRESRCIIIQGSERDFADAKSIVASKQKKLSGERQRGETECSVCFCEADEPIHTSCNHTYCGLCFIDMCQAQASAPLQFCITCVGNSDQCGHIFELAEIRNLLLSETFEDILEASFRWSTVLSPRRRNTRQPLPATSVWPPFAQPATPLILASPVKKELGIQDCPRCETSMEKTDGCNHMTCKGCSCHICWVCLATFDEDSACYAHMRRLHGGIGI